MTEEKKSSKRKGGPGRPKGIKNRLTVQRETAARLAVERQKEIERLELMGGDARFVDALTSGIHLAKDVLERFMRISTARAMYYAPTEPGQPENINANHDIYRESMGMAVEIAKALLPTQTPRLSAVLVGASVVNTISVMGGLPEDQDGGLRDAAMIIEGTVNRDEEAA